MKSIRSLGIEIELFLQKKPVADDEIIIHNANKELQELLGFSIDQNSDGGSGDGPHVCLLKYIDRCIRLRTDGTPIEFQALLDYRKISALPEYVVKNFLSQIQNSINTIQCGLLKQYNFLYDCYLQTKPKLPYYAKFLNTGNIFASEKTIFNAYTGESSEQEKKESYGKTKVTERTCGLHVHFGIDQDAITQRTITDRIIRNLDELLQREFRISDLGNGATLRETKYQHKGIYRIKRHPDGFQTLEYRQLTPMFLRDKLLFRFLVLADEEICRILKIT